MFSQQYDDLFVYSRPKGGYPDFKGWTVIVRSP